MSLFVSPKKLASAVRKDSNGFQEYQKSAAWFLTAEGKQAFEKAETLADKVLFYYKMLLSTAPVFKKSTYSLYSSDMLSSAHSGEGPDPKAYAMRIAWIMADAMTYSKQPFAGWPNMLDERTNPLLHWLRKSHREIKEINATFLITALRTGDMFDYKEYGICDMSDYPKLTPYSPETEDIYLIEREFLFAFPGPATQKYERVQSERLRSEFEDELTQWKETIVKERLARLKETAARILKTISGGEALISQSQPEDTIQMLDYIAELYNEKETISFGIETLQQSQESQILLDYFSFNTENDKIKAKENLSEKLCAVQNQYPNPVAKYQEAVDLSPMDKSNALYCISQFLGAMAGPVAIVLGVIFTLCITFNAPIGLTWILFFILAGVIALLVISRGGKDIKEDISITEKGDAWKQRAYSIDYSASRQRFLAECFKFDAAYNDAVSQYMAYKTEEEAKRKNEKTRLDILCRNTVEAAKNHIEQIDRIISSQTVLIPEYAYLAEDISLALRSKRVDNMRDALNLAIREDERRKEAEARQRALERQIEDEQEAQMEMQRIAQQQAEEEARHNAAMERAQEQARWEAEQSRRAAAEDARRAQQAAEDAARQEKWAAQAEARRAETRSRNAYYAAKKAYDSANLLYRGAVNAHGVNSSDALRHKANMDKAMADMINSGYSG